MSEILVIDDSLTTLVMLEYFLQDNGFKIHVSGNIKDALEYLSENKPDLILLDINLPGVSGFDFLRSYKNDERIKSIPVIIISGYYTNVSVKEVEELGANAFVPKPFKLSELLNTIREFVK